VKTFYERLPLVKRFFKPRETEVKLPTDLVPSGM
jgi:hypothetical protein